MDLHGARVLAFGTAGAQGSGLVEALTQRGATAVRVTSDPARAASWGAAAVVADLARPDTVARAAAGADAAALHVPLGLSDPAALRDSVRALREAGLPVAVNLGAPVPPPGAPDPSGARGLAEALLDAGAVALSPTAYLENHAAPYALELIDQGVLAYPRPAGDVVAWISARDVTAAAVAALAQGREGELLALAGPQPLRFDELAAELGAGLGRDLTFRRLSPAEFGELLRPGLGDAAADRVVAAYAAMPEAPNPLLSRDAGEAWQALGIAATPARTWAAMVLAPLLTAAAAR